MGSSPIACVNISILSDTQIEGDHEFVVEITNVGGAAAVGDLYMTTVVIQDDEGSTITNAYTYRLFTLLTMLCHLAIQVANVTVVETQVMEADEEAIVCVQLSVGELAVDIAVYMSTSDETAQSKNHFYEGHRIHIVGFLAR